MKKFYLALMIAALMIGSYFWKNDTQQKSVVTISTPSVDEPSPLVHSASLSGSNESTATAVTLGESQTILADPTSFPLSNGQSGNSFSESGFSKDFVLNTFSKEPDLSHSPVFTFRTALNIPEIVRDFSKTYDLKVSLGEPSPIKELSGILSLQFRSLHELNPDTFLAVADVAVFDSDSRQWRRMTGKESKDFSVSNPYEFEFNPRDGTFRGDIHESILPLRLHQAYWLNVPLIDLRRLSCRGIAEKYVERGEFTRKITGDVFVKVFIEQEKSYADRKVGTCVLTRR